MSGPGTRRQYPCRTCSAAIYSDGTYWRTVRDDTRHCASDSIGHLPDAARAAAPSPEPQYTPGGLRYPTTEELNGGPLRTDLPMVRPPAPVPAAGLRELLRAIDAFDEYEQAHPLSGGKAERWLQVSLARAALAASPAPEPDVDEAGLPITHDAHSRDWFEGYAAGRAEAPEPTGLAAYQRGVGDAAHLMRCSCGEQGYDFECAICGDYSAQGVEVHESCLEMLSRGGAAAPEPTGLDVERLRWDAAQVRLALGSRDDEALHYWAWDMVDAMGVGAIPREELLTIPPPAARLTTEETTE